MRWLRSHPLTSCALGILLVVLGTHFFANWRTETRWRHYVTEIQSRGIHTSFHEMMPPEIPESENFAALPMFQSLFVENDRPSALDLPLFQGKRPHFGDWLKGESVDWQAWQTYFQNLGWISEATDSPPRDVLRGLERFAPQVRQWHEWPQRTHGRFALDWEHRDAFVPHMLLLYDAAQLFNLRMRAHLALGESAAAYADFEDAMQARRVIEHEPTIVANSLRIGILGYILHAVGYGLREKAWAAADLQRIDHALTQTRVWHDIRRALEIERLEVNSILDRVVTASPWRRSEEASKLLHLPGNPFDPVTGLAPQRFFREDQLRINRYCDALEARVSADGLQYDADRAAVKVDAHFNGHLDQLNSFLFSRLTSRLDDYVVGIERLHILLEMTRTAMALERYRQKHGGFPETLEQLVPIDLPALPMDLYAKKPLLYHRLDGGTYRLYSVGSNRNDDGGIIDPKNHYARQLDIIWPYPPAPSSTPP